MSEIVIKNDPTSIALAAAEMAVAELSSAIDNRGKAVWVLAGGSSPMTAYKLIAADYKDQLDWSRVTVLLGDERCVPLGHADSNWSGIEEAILTKLPFESTHKLRPQYELPAEEAANLYQEELGKLEADTSGIPIFDLVWLGMGEDGHTLSLFPGHPALDLTGPFVVPVHDSPKPPPDRISLSLKALSNSKTCVIMAAGAGKAEAVAGIRKNDASLPVVQAINVLEASGCRVTLLLDEAAAA